MNHHYSALVEPVYVKKQMLASLSAIVFCAIVIGAAFSDLLTMRIPNWISISLIAAFFIFFIVRGAPYAALWPFVLGGAATFIVCFGLFALGWIGGGDAKLLSSMALWFGWSASLIGFLLWTAIAGLALTILLLLLRSLPMLPLFLTRWEWVVRLHDRKNGVPYGIAIALGGVIMAYQGRFPLAS